MKYWKLCADGCILYRDALHAPTLSHPFFFLKTNIEDSGPRYQVLMRYCKICADGYFSYRKLLHAPSHSKTLYLPLNVIKWSSKSSYLLVKITKLCVKWFLFKYKNKMRHPPFPLQRHRFISSLERFLQYLTRHVTFQKAATAPNALFLKRRNVWNSLRDLIFFWHPWFLQSNLSLLFSLSYIIPSSSTIKPFTVLNLANTFQLSFPLNFIVPKINPKSTCKSTWLLRCSHSFLPTTLSRLRTLRLPQSTLQRTT